MLITSKEQITIPQQIRNKCGVLPHTAVEVVEKNGVDYLVKVQVKHSRGAQIINTMPGKATVKMTTDEIMALTREK
jgi:bifunctional DNA-binding transcriptional regulator/antitoxin component of YhaV-PrlF toxin-antitoxin module